MVGEGRSLHRLWGRVMTKTSMHSDQVSGQQHSAAASSNEKRRCPVCGESIWVKASKCIHCDSDLDWRRYFVFGNTSLALLTALISVIITSIPVLTVIATPNNSKISAVVIEISASGETMSMLYKNSGRQTGAVTTLWLSISYQISNEQRQVLIFPHTDNDVAFFLEGGKSQGVKYNFKTAPIWQPTKAANNEKDQNDLATLIEERYWKQKSAKCEVDYVGTNADGSPIREKTGLYFETNADGPAPGTEVGYCPPYALAQVFKHLPSQITQ